MTIQERCDLMARRIWWNRRVAGLTLRELGALSGISADAISSAEREGTVTVAQLSAIAKALDIDPGVLLDP